MKKILVVGDVHGNFGKLNALINVKRPELIICCGEFGYWPLDVRPNAKSIQDINTHGAKLLWIDGNHEDFYSLNQRKTDELAPNIVYMPRGSIYTLPDGRKILFMGGANSIDKDMRTEGRDWFPDEQVSQRDFQNALHPGWYPGVPEEIDIFITHTCPRELVKELAAWDGEEEDPTTLALSQLWRIYNPDLWIFAHWHTYKKGTYGRTQWYCLGHVEGLMRWRMWLPPKKSVVAP